MTESDLKSQPGAGPDDPAILPSYNSLVAIIPAYNERGRIGRVIKVLCQVKKFDEIIIVDDGSQDSTVEEVREQAQFDNRIKVIVHPANRGKGDALFSGWHATHAKYLLFLDADIQGLTPQHIEDLILPVLSGKADMSIGLFRSGRINTDFSHWATPWLSGQRCLRAELMEHVSPEAAAGYGVETAITIAAHQEQYLCQRVIFKGVWHPSSEFHRGLFSGIKIRGRMYAQIFRAWKTASGGWRGMLPRLKTRSRLFLLLVLVLLFSVIYDRSLARGDLHLADIPPIPLQDSQRILVISPHPDDEVLGAGGLIETALQQGKQVRVVIVTNGDGQRFAPLALHGRIWTKPKDYVQDGEARQVESLNGLSVLGLPKSDVSFLGYPDSQLDRLWMMDWNLECPLNGIRTHSSRSPYMVTYDPNSSYCGSDIVKDLHQLMEDFQPDLVVLPHPNDEHPDHRAASSFGRLAAAEYYDEHPDRLLQTWGYLVHYGYYPQPRGPHPGQALLPPVPLSGAGNEWARLDLSSGQVQRKLTSIHQYKSQILLLGSFLPSFARPDEIYLKLPQLDLSPVAVNMFPLAEEGVVQQPFLQEPVDESARRVVVTGADLTGWRVVRLNDKLWITAETHGRLVPGFQYRLFVKTPDGKTKVYTYSPLRPWMDERYFTNEIDLADLGNPQVLAFAADVKQGVTLDRTSWRFVILRDR